MLFIRLRLYCEMVLFSAELTVIKDSIIKISDKVARDYVELEILQNSQRSPDQFVEMTIDFIRKKMFEYFKSKKPHYDIIFQGENNKGIDFKSEYRYLITPMCGKINLIHAIPYFSISVALLKRNKDGEYKTVCGLIDNPITQETYLAEEGRGAYVNSRRIRISSRPNLDDAFVVIKNVDDRDFICSCIKKYKNITVTNCEILNICSVASGKYDLTVLNKAADYQELALLLFKEAGGIIKTTENGEVVLCNELLSSKI